jgi:hypothetical protein
MEKIVAIKVKYTPVRIANIRPFYSATIGRYHMQMMVPNIAKN